MLPLPIDPHLPAIISELARSRSLVVFAPPGAGKTTRVPPAMVVTGAEGHVVSAPNGEPR